MDPNTLAIMMGAAGASSEKIYVEDVFSTWLYSGSSSDITITNGIDLSGKGGLVWLKSRTNAANHFLGDTARTANTWLNSNTTDAQASEGAADGITYSSTGFVVKSAGGNNRNVSGQSYASWTFRKAPKFFDVVTYTGDGTDYRSISHNLGSTPGFVAVKALDAVDNWVCWHRGIGNNWIILLNKSDQRLSSNLLSSPTSTNFQVRPYSPNNCNQSGVSYVAYLFAHDAGGFGDSGSDNVISCGSYTGNGSTTGPTVTLGWEPQWLLIKRTDTTADWNLIDNMRGFVVGGADAELNPNLSAAESSGTFVSPLSTGFQLNTTDAGYNANSGTYIYIAIRRGPMKTPTDATEVFGLAEANNANSLVWGAYNEVNQRRSAYADLVFAGYRAGNAKNMQVADRLRGFMESSYLGSVSSTTPTLSTSSTSTEQTSGNLIYRRNDISGIPTGIWLTFASGVYSICHAFRRAPGFFDVVAYTGVGSGVAIPHNLGVAPQMIIAKNRGRAGYPFVVWTAFTGTGGAALNSTGTFGAANMTPAVTSSTITYESVGYEFNFGSTDNYIAYLFASCSGVSKVGSYTGNGSSQTINCGFAAGSRYVLIKRTDSTGDWLVADTARGLVSGNDPLLYLNSTAAEITTLDWIDPDSTGFVVNQEATANANVNGATYIYLAVA